MQGCRSEALTFAPASWDLERGKSEYAVSAQYHRDVSAITIIKSSVEPLFSFLQQRKRIQKMWGIGTAAAEEENLRLRIFGLPT